MLSTLIVDSSEERKLIYQQMLKRSFDLHFAESIDQGVKLFNEKKPLLLIIVADIEDGKGVSLCKSIKKHPSGKAVRILLAGKDLNDEILGRDMAVSLGGDDIIQLPFKPEKLKIKLKELVNQLIAEKKARETKSAKPEPSPVTTDGKHGFERPLVKKLNLDLKQEFKGITDEQIESIGKDKLLEIASLYKVLSATDYYALLGVDPKTNAGIIRKSFFKLTKDYHPDRYTILNNPTLSKNVAAIFKTMSEAYQVLLKPEKRKHYDEVLLKKEGVRLIEKSRDTEGPKREDAEIKNPQAKKFYNLAVSAIGENNFSAAKMNLTLALSMAPNEQVIKNKLSEVEEKLKLAE